MLESVQMFTFLIFFSFFIVQTWKLDRKILRQYNHSDRPNIFMISINATKVFEEINSDICTPFIIQTFQQQNKAHKNKTLFLLKWINLFRILESQNEMKNFFFYIYLCRLIWSKNYFYLYWRTFKDFSFG